jgi:hypothetical protein
MKAPHNAPFDPKLTNAVVKVNKARGLIVQDFRKQLCVITAAHCLPIRCDECRGKLPQPFMVNNPERIYSKLLGPLGDPATVSAECLFADPISDIAVFCMPWPDNQNPDADEAFMDLVEKRLALSVGTLPFSVTSGLRQFDSNKKDAWVLSLDQRRVHCSVRRSQGKVLHIEDVSVYRGMSGAGRH